MNTAKIAALYPYFRALLSATDRYGRSLSQLLQVKLDSDTVAAGGPRYHASVTDRSNTLPRLDYLGMETLTAFEGFISQRVYVWAASQMPAADIYDALVQGDTWAVYLHGRQLSTAGRHEALSSYGSAATFGNLLRGLRSYQRKQDRYAGKLLAQLRAYHLQQVFLAAPVPAKAVGVACEAKAAHGGVRPMFQPANRIAA